MVLCKQMSAITYKLLISDYNSVLIDSEILADQVIHEALTSFIPNAPLEHLLKTTFGQTTREVLRQVKERFALQLPETLLAQIQTRSEALIQAQMQPITGMRKTLKQIPLPLAVASNNRRHTVITSIERIKLTAHTTGRIFSANMIKRPKPAPNVYLLTARTAKIAPKRCLIIKDNPTNTATAITANIQVLRFTSANHIPPAHDNTLHRIDVLEVFNNMHDLPALFKQLAQKRTR